VKKDAKASEPMKIPAFLNCSLTAKANTVLYDNLVLKDVAGKLLIKDQKVTLDNVKTNIFGGQIAVNGDVSTKEKTPKFNMDLRLTGVDIQQTFTQLEMMKKIAPIAGVINGKLNSKIKLSGNLNATEMTPDLNSISGDLLGQLLSTTVNSSNFTLLSALDEKLGFVDLKDLNLNDLKASLTFKDGKVTVKPFDLKYKDVKVNVGGIHGFDQVMNYTMKLDVPAKYLGTEITTLIGKLAPADAKKFESIPITALIGGNFKNPKITTDVKQATTTLVTNLVKTQKDKLIKQGTSALTDLINKNKKPSDTTKTVAPTTKKDVETKAKDLLKGLFNKPKKE
jgi:hypothetical protein